MCVVRAYFIIRKTLNVLRGAENCCSAMSNLWSGRYYPPLSLSLVVSVRSESLLVSPHRFSADQMKLTLRADIGIVLKKQVLVHSDLKGLICKRVLCEKLDLCESFY